MGKGQISIFLVIITTIFTVGFLYIDRSLLRRLAGSPRQRNLYRVLFASILVMQVVGQSLYRANTLYTWSGPLWLLAWASLTGLGFAAFLLFLSWVADFARGVTRGALRLQQRTPETLADPSRRLFFGRQLPAAIVGTAAVSTLAGVAQARTTPQVETVEIPLRGLPPQFDGFSIAQISDLHVGPTIGASFVQNVVDRTLAAGADLIVLTGDMVDGKVPQVESVFAILGQLRATYGVFFITGNHEYFSGAEAWIRYIPTLGITPLVNAHRLIRKDGAHFALGGIPDVVGPRFLESHTPDMKQTFAGAPADALRILLAHQPNHTTVGLSATNGVALQLSGHTHAGQFYPFAFFARLVLPYFQGRYTHRTESGHTTELYVNRGTGYWGPPVRLGVRPEISKIVLRVQA